MNTQTQLRSNVEAERLADLVERHPSDDVELVRAAAELRRLASFNNDLMDEVSRLKSILHQECLLRKFNAENT